MLLKKERIGILLTVLLLLLCTASCAWADTQELQVSNTPVKGQILLNKTGLQLNALKDRETRWLKGAVFEIRAAEDIIGRDGTKWLSRGDLAATITSSGEGTDESELLPLGRYEVTELSAPSGYIRDKHCYTAELKAVDHQTPVVTVTVSSMNDPVMLQLKKVDQANEPLAGAEFGLFDVNGLQIASAFSDDEGRVVFDFVPHGQYSVLELNAPEGYLPSRKEISVTVTQDWMDNGNVYATVTDQKKEIMFIKTDTAGMPMSGITFQLINADTGKVAETAVSDENGVFTFTKFDYGSWLVHEKNTPKGFGKMPDYTFTVADDWTAPAPILCVNIPNHYEFRKTDSGDKPLKGVQFVLEDENGKELQKLESDADGMVYVRDLAPGTYFIRETKTLEGFTLSGETKKLIIDSTYVIPEKLPVWVNYTTIQTGVNIAVTWIMWVGLGIMAVSGTLGIIRRRKQSGKNGRHV